jgi:hypothetical protein
MKRHHDLRKDAEPQMKSNKSAGMILLPSFLVRIAKHPIVNCKVHDSSGFRGICAKTGWRRIVN